MAHRLRLPSTLLFLAALLLAACAPAGSGSPSATTLPSVSSVPSAPAHSVYPLTLTDDAGREVTIPEAPTRIVSLAPSNTEIVCALDACDELVGVTDYDDYPAQVADVTHVVVGAVVDIEKVVAAEPELILAGGNEVTSSAVIDQLTLLGYPVLSLYPRDLQAVYDDISLVGAAIDARPAAEELVASMRARGLRSSPRWPAPHGRAPSTRSASTREASTPQARTRSSPRSSRLPVASRCSATRPRP